MEMAEREKITWSKFGKDFKLSIRRLLGAASFLGILRTTEAAISGKIIPEFYFMGLILLTLGFFGYTTLSNSSYFNKSNTNE